MEKEELITTITDLIKEYGGFVSLTLSCRPYTCIRYNDMKKRYETKYNPTWDIESWQDINELDRNTLDKICTDINFR
jgi:hypothetical protein